MPARRTVAPDIVGCSFLLYAATLSFSVLRAPYAHSTVPAVAIDLAIYGGLLVVCTVIGLGLFRRRSWALWPAILLSVAVFFAGLMAWHVPDTAQLPAGVLGASGVVLLLGRRIELSDTDGASKDEDDADPDAPASTAPTAAAE
jgi:hypothetical protein